MRSGVEVLRSSSFLMLVLAVSGCGSPSAESTPPAGMATVGEGVNAPGEDSLSPVIGHFRTRDRLLTVHSGDEGPRFTVSTSDGDVLERLIPAAELEVRHPALFDAFQSSIAGKEGVLDARLNPVTGNDGPGEIDSPREAPGGRKLEPVDVR